MSKMSFRIIRYSTTKKKNSFAIGFYSVSVFSNKIVNVFIVELSNFCLFSSFLLPSQVCLNQQKFVVAKKVKSKGPKQVKIRSFPRSSNFSNLSFIPRYSPCCKPVKLGHTLHCITASYFAPSPDLIW